MKYVKRALWFLLFLSAVPILGIVLNFIAGTIDPWCNWALAFGRVHGEFYGFLLSPFCVPLWGIVGALSYFSAVDLTQ